MTRENIYYVLPLGEAWLLRAIDSAAHSYSTLADALAAAERLAARGAHVRVLSAASPQLQRGRASQPDDAMRSTG